MDYSFSKISANVEKLVSEISQLSLASKVSGVSHLLGAVVVNTSSELTSEEQLELSTTISNHDPATTTHQSLTLILLGAMQFGQHLIIQYAAENIALGITQSGMTGVVRKRLEQVVNALLTGSLYDAITEIRAIPQEDKDGVFISDTRLLKAINDIEQYLGLPLSTSL